MQNMLKSLTDYFINPNNETGANTINTYFTGQKEDRPWGSWEVLAISKNICIKKIVVNPKGILSLQVHKYRKEAWFFSSGVATVLVNGIMSKCSQGDTILIEENIEHRLSNESDTICELIEIQFGECLKEDDIIRIEDVYGRNEK